MADLYEVSGVCDHDRRHFFNASRSTLTASGVIGQGRSVRQTLARSAALLRRSGVDGVNLTINRAAVVGDCDGRPVRAAPGAVQFRDMGRPSASRLDSVDLMTVLVPRNLAPPGLLGPDLHGLVLPPDKPGARLIMAHITTLVSLAESLSEEELETSMQALLLVTGRVAGADADITGPTLTALQNTVRRAAAEFVEGRVETMALPIDIDAVAAAAGVSRATLYRAFDGEGGVNRFVQDRRLHHARNALRRRNGPNPTIADIAQDFGFPSPSHFSRLFRARYGYSPAEVEGPRAPVNLSMREGPIRHDLMSDWLKELRR